MKILVVCSGNICRSPMAEIILQDLADTAGLDLEVHSAGTLDIDGAEASGNGVLVCRAHGLSLEKFRSTALSGVPLQDYDQVLVMEPKHAVRVKELSDGLETAIHLVRKFSGESAEVGAVPDLVPDPIGQDIAAYRATFTLIRRCLQGYVRQLKI